MNKLQQRTVWMGSALALLAGITIAPSAIALPEAGRTSISETVIAQALDTTTATVVDVDPREDTVRLRLANGNLRMFSLSTQEQQQLGLAAGSEVMLTMNGDRIITMTRMISSEPAASTMATVVDTDSSEDTVRLRLADGSVRMFSLPAQDQQKLGLASGSEVMLTMNGDRIITMTRMMSVQPAERMIATVIEVSPREDRVRVRLADGSIRLLALSVQEQSRLGLRRGSEVTVTSRGNRIDTMIFNNTVATVTEQS